MKHLEKLTRKRLGEILIDEGLISKAQIADAEREQKRTGETLGSILVEAGYISDLDLAKIVATQYQLPFVRLDLFPRVKEIAQLFPLAQMKKHRFVPVDRIGDIMTLAVAEMPDIRFLHGLQGDHGVTPYLFVAEMSDIMARLGGAKSEGAPILAGESATPSPAAPAPTPDEDGEPPERIPGVEGMEESPFGTEEGGEPGTEDSDGSWQNIFDVANESILNEMDSE